jgi:hypothetical protein
LCIMVVDTSAINATREAVDFGGDRFHNIFDGFYFRSTICGGTVSVGLLVCFVELCLLCCRLIYVAPDLKVQITPRDRNGGGFCFSICAFFTFNERGIRSRLPWLKASRCITNDFEVPSERWSNIGRSIVCVDLCEC